MSEASDDLLRVFRAEAVDRIERLESLLLEIEAEPERRELLDEFMRVAHTIKGSASMVGLSVTADLAHALETVVERLRDRRIRVSAELFDRAAEAVDSLAQGCDRAATAVAGEPAELGAALRSLTEWLEAGEDAACGSDEAPVGGFVLGEYDRLRIDMLRQQGKRLVEVEVPFSADAGAPLPWAGKLQRCLREIGVVVTTRPPASELGDLERHGALVLLVATEHEADAVVSRCRETGFEAATIRDTQLTPEPRRPRAEVERALVADRTVRVELEVLDDLLRLVGELMISRGRLEQVAAELDTALQDRELGNDVGDSAAQLGQLATMLQDAVMRARMIPIARVFRAVKRQVRAAARRRRQLEVTVSSAGERTEIDKNLVDSLGAPLGRLAEAMVAAVPEASAQHRVWLTAERRWNQVVLQIGSSGPPPSPEEVETFSAAIAAAGGHMEPGGNTAFVASLPLTLAIVRVMMASAGDEVYAFPLEGVRETLRLAPGDVATIDGAPVVDSRGEALPLVYLGQALEVPGAARAGGQVIVLAHAEGSAGVVVEQLHGIREVVIKPLSTQLAGARILTGSALMGDDRIALILDGEALLAECLGSGRADAGPATQE